VLVAEAKPAGDPYGRHMNPNPSSPTRVVIVGGGVAALEAMLAIRDLGGERVKVDVFAPRKDFVLKPLGVSEAFGYGEVLTYDLESLAERSGSSFHLRSVTLIETENRRVALRDGTEVPYDYLVVATGTKALWVIPGAKTFWGLHGQEVISEVIQRIAGDSPAHIVLTMPEPAVWPLPIYELALFLATEVEKSKGSQSKVTVVTPETSPLATFGPGASAILSDLLERHSVGLVTDTTPVDFSEGTLNTMTGESIAADEVITVPRLTGRQIDGLSFNPEGFLTVDGFGRIEGLEREYAAGDVISYPIKFGGVATEQADVVAASIARDAWGDPEPEPFRPVLRGTLLTSDGPVALGVSPASENGATDESDSWDPVRKVRGKHLTPFLESEKE